MTDGLIHHYPLRGDLNNIIDPTLPASRTSTELGPDRFNKANSSLSNLDPATVDAIIIPNETMNGLLDFTVCLWVNMAERN